ncbi:MAG TPA: acyl-CoA synthetase [Candidatus Binatia bacterium]|jgi:acyl-coenzyme A synthetase/AMP-(fatty) acid ligase|nr:acyl-CoA synthetase [Candidatus Binatia bacterium]
MTGFPPWTWDIPARFNIGTACTDAHLGTPIASRAAVIVDDDATGVTQRTFAELADVTSRFAGLLRQLGCAAGDRVLIRLPNHIAYPIAFLGATKRGAIPVPTSVQLTPGEVAYVAANSGAVVLVTDRTTWNVMHDMLESQPSLRHVLLTGSGEAVAAQRVGLHDLEPALAAAPVAEPHPTAADDPAYLVYTSGTTGWPKGVLHAHRALIGRQPSSTYWFDFQASGDRVLHAGKYNWTYVLGTGMMDPLYRGHTTIVHEGSTDATLWPGRIARHAATIFIGVPTIYRQILQKTNFAGAAVPTLRHCMSAGEPLPAEVLAEWERRFGLEVYEALGMTECSYYLCETRSRPIRPGSAGFVQPGHDVQLLDPETLTPVPPSAEGMLCIPRTDPGLLLRYWNQPEETAATFRDDWYLTGDYARRDEDGYVWFLGRRDDLINTFGYRVSPHEVDRVLREHPAVADAATVGETLEPGKVLVTSYVVLLPGAGADADTLLAHGREHLAAYKAPRIVYLVDELPRTRNGKVLRRALTPSLATARSRS